MRVLCLYPGINIEVNDNAHVLLYLARRGVDLSVICSKVCALKSAVRLADYEDMRGIPIHRVYRNFAEQCSFPVRYFDTIYDIAHRFRPDILFCSQQGNMHIACRLKAAFDIPIVLLVEYAYDPVKLVRRRWYLGLKPLAFPVAGLYWRWLSRNTRAIITSYIGDRQHIRHLARYKTPVYYIPWCNQIPEDVATREVRKESARAIYVGSLSRWKNTQEFAETIPIILGHTPVKEFVIVGSGSDRDVVNRVARLSAGRVTHLESLSRVEALSLIQDSYFAYTPVKAGGWGFMGDSWGVKTPLVATHNEYGLCHGVDSLVVDRRDKIHLFINQLYEVPGLYEKLQKGGYERYAQQHTAASVGDKLLKVLESVIAGQNGSSVDPGQART